MFSGNQFRDNWSDLVLSGAGSTTRWSAGGRGNYWSRYRGFDFDGDGVGDAPHPLVGAFEKLEGDNPAARIFLQSPAAAGLELAARLGNLARRRRPWTRVPLVTPRGVAADRRRAGHAPGGRGPDGRAARRAGRSLCSGRRDHAHARCGDEVVRRTSGSRPSRSRDRRGRERRPDRRERLGQDHDAAVRGRPRAARRGADHDRRHSTSSRDPIRARQRISYLPQRPLFPPTLTVRETLAVVARLRQATDARTSTGRSRRAGSAPSPIGSVVRLSGGERQRLGMAVALLPAADLYLFDEPSANLDPASSRILFQRARQLQRDGRAAALHDAHSGRRPASRHAGRPAARRPDRFRGGWRIRTEALRADARTIHVGQRP